jgi:DNA polymerase III alpha subunit (gram-positive type)
MESESKDQFSRYICPGLPISAGAEKATHITWSGGVLSYLGEPVPFMHIKPALEEFLDWVQKFQNVVIVAHNGRLFDFKVLCNALVNCDLQQMFTSRVSAFCDSLTLLRNKYPKLQKYTQIFLADHFCGETYNAHNAADDATMLCKLMEAADVSVTDYKKHSYDRESHFLQEKFNLCKSKNIASLQILIGKGVMKACTAENIAGSGLHLSHLELIFKRDGEDGLVNVFSMKNCIGKPRVTNDKKVLGECIPKLCKFFSSGTETGS